MQAVDRLDDLRNRNDRWSIVEYRLAPVSMWFEVDGITEVSVNRYDTVYVTRAGRSQRAEDLGAELGLDGPFSWRDEADLRACIAMVAASLDQQAHEQARPLIDARLPSGARLSASLKPVSALGCSMSIRLFPKVRWTFDALRERRTFSEEQAAQLCRAVPARANILIAGAMGSGKTSLLNALIGLVAPEERLIVVEDTFELCIDAPNVVRLEAAVRDVGQAEQITTKDLLKHTMRRAPSRIIVGEFRDSGDAHVFLQTMRLGHRGALASMHGNSAEEALDRFVDLAHEAAPQKPYEAIKAAVYRNVDLVVHMVESDGGRRTVREILEVAHG
ncbi:MAG: CpaF family protein [Gammaproteobacteria bacterium]